MRRSPTPLLFAIAAAVFLGACSQSPTAAPARQQGGAQPRADGATPPDTTHRGGIYLGSGN